MARGVPSGKGVWGSLDVSSHTLSCASSNALVGLFAASYGAVGLLFNLALLRVAQIIGPNMRVFVFTARGVLTWAAEVALYYSKGFLGVTGTGLGLFSLLELLGFGLLIWCGAERARLVAAREAGQAGSGAEDAGKAQGERGESTDSLSAALLKK